MSESQSRYSIVERLTTQKLELMRAKSNLNQSILERKQNIESLKLDIIREKKVFDDEATREKAELDKALRTAENTLKTLIEQQEEKEMLFKEQIGAIDIALNRIEEISKSSTIQ